MAVWHVVDASGIGGAGDILVQCMGGRTGTAAPPYLESVPGLRGSFPEGASTYATYRLLPVATTSAL